ncbi:MAG: peptidoglycan-binding protein [Rhodospirillaceae bacterium]|jgi:hypothetical protein|nr:peptidoglycan-binding protein [Rhodospirillaceae bacterium]MBT5013680.1 peptidoglycan-binding protein [Rhodospirillaceae bacterium]MBT5309714.1 peptidoglycan-binding protein [Rhodospirillaceae bacterium]MBT7355028.1 peptidoglycan-binding protein [Rhodospirillaceae bacterium]
MRKLFLLLLIAPFIVISPTGGEAARPPDVPTTVTDGQLDQHLSNPLVVRVQKALAKAGYYKGSIDGIAGPITIDAIETYQKRENQSVDGIVSAELAIHIETSVKVRSLLDQLHEKRLANISAARKALMAQPETRDILTGNKSEAAQASRDPSECFRMPNPECLLTEAVESAKAIHKREHRDWAFGEILSAQAKAGLVKAAIGSVRLIGDARLIMVALRDIAEAQAETGRPAEALAAADIIPDAIKQSEALAAIAAIQVEGRDLDGAAATAGRILDGLADIDDPLRRLALRLRAVVILSKADKQPEAEAELKKARAFAEANSGDNRAVALRHVAGALADMGLPDAALEIIKDLSEASEQTPVLVSAAKAQAKAGDLKHAVSTAEAIQAVRYRAVVLARIAIAQVEADEIEEAHETVLKAIESSEQIKLPYARAYAHDRIAAALTEIGEAGDADAFETAIELAGGIVDDKLRSHRLWSIAAAQRRAGDGPGSDDTETLAERATGEVKSALTRAWMFTDLALEHLDEGNATAAWASFHRALGITADITNPWARARALAHLASSHVDLSDAIKPVAGKQ